MGRDGKITDEAMKHILTNSQLRTLSLTSNYSMPEGSFTPLIDLQLRMPSLTFLFLNGCIQLGDKDIIAISKGCPSLRKLDLEGRLEHIYV